MTKTPANRPSTAEILKMDYVRDRMQRFVEDTEMENNMQNPVFKKQRPTIRRVGTRENNQIPDFTPAQARELDSTSTSIPNATVQFQGKDMSAAQNNTLTPKERMALRKAEEIKKREEELKQAT